MMHLSVINYSVA